MQYLIEKISEVVNISQVGYVWRYSYGVLLKLYRYKGSSARATKSIEVNLMYNKNFVPPKVMSRKLQDN